jgi:hypothetical protein
MFYRCYLFTNTAGDDSWFCNPYLSWLLCVHCKHDLHLTRLGFQSHQLIWSILEFCCFFEESAETFTTITSYPNWGERVTEKIGFPRVVYLSGWYAHTIFTNYRFLRDLIYFSSSQTWYMDIPQECNQDEQENWDLHNSKPMVWISFFFTNITIIFIIKIILNFITKYERLFIWSVSYGTR